MAEKIKIEGLKELGNAIRDLEEELKNEIGIKAIAAGSFKIRDEARSLAPVLKVPTKNRKPGTLRDSIQYTAKYLGNFQFESKIYVRGLSKKQIRMFKQENRKMGSQNPDDPYYWVWVELGAAQMSSMPFMRPAFSSKKDFTMKTITNSLSYRITDAGEKAGKKHSGSK